MSLKHQVGRVGAQQGSGTAHDRLQHRFQVAQGGEVAGCFVQGGEFGFAAAAFLQLGSQSQRVVDERTQPRQFAGGAAVQQRLVLPGRGAVVEQAK